MNLKTSSLFLCFLLLSCLKAGELPFIMPDLVAPVPYQAELSPGGAVQIDLAGQKYLVECDLSLIPGWAHLSAAPDQSLSDVSLAGNKFSARTPNFRIERSIERNDEALVVRDRITNLSDRNLPLMYRQKLRLDKVKEYRLCGYRIYSKRGNGSNNINATTICMPEAGGSIGLLALSDVFRAHFRAFAAMGYYGIGDDNLVIMPGVTQEMSFAIFPSQKDGYYDQINAMRRFLKVNYEIPAGFAFLSPNPPGVITFNPDYDRIGKDNSVEEIATWLHNKSADYVCDGAVSALKEHAHGTAWNKSAKPEIHTAFHEKIRQARPSVKLFHYFHCYIDIKSLMEGDFEKDRILTPSGKQADYRNPNLPLFMPVEGSSWADMQEKRLIRLRDEYKLDGIFWDEFTHSATDYHYGEPWDGLSADIDPRTHEILRLKTSVVLATLPWRLRMLEMFVKHDLRLIANGGGGYTQTMTEQFVKNKFIAFMETGAVTDLYCSHLSTPIGLGDHITERNELDCYRGMLRFLDFGSLYFYYHQQVEPFTHPTLTRYMFPITPNTLGEGYIIGDERIITKKSGYYSLGAKEEAEAHFFDANGYEVQRELKSIEKDGRRYYLIELNEFESCALVKK